MSFKSGEQSQMLRHEQHTACVLYSGMLLSWFPVSGATRKIYGGHRGSAIFQHLVQKMQIEVQVIYKLQFQVIQKNNHQDWAKRLDSPCHTHHPVGRRDEMCRKTAGRVK